ncbi:MAG: flagellar biosynthetic protein FliQ, partial [Oceanisphaera sp.]
QTLSFLPRLLVTLGALAVGAHWGFGMLMDFFYEQVAQIQQVIG